MTSALKISNVTKKGKNVLNKSFNLTKKSIHLTKKALTLLNVLNLNKSRKAETENKKNTDIEKNFAQDVFLKGTLDAENDELSFQVKWRNARAWLGKVVEDARFSIEYGYPEDELTEEDLAGLGIE